MYNKKTTRKNFSRKYCVFGAKSPFRRLPPNEPWPLAAPLEKIGRHGGFVGYFDYFCKVNFLLRMTLRRLLCVLLSAALLSAGWLGLSGLPLLAALVPLLWISHGYGPSRGDWWRMFGWAWLAFVLWNGATIWGLWYSTPVGPFAATLASTFLNMLAFMLFHTVSKRAHKALAYTLLVAGWITTEYWYTVGEFSFPWLLLGNGFANDVRAVQWYEYTGLFGGSLWVLVCNLLLFEAWLHRRSVRHWVRAALVVAVPLAVSLTIYARWEEPSERIEVAVVQPNVDCYDKFNTGADGQLANLLSLLGEVPSSARLIAMPETALVEGINESYLAASPSLGRIEAALAADHPDALLVVGADTYKVYAGGNRTGTARFRNGIWYDRFNTALALDAEGVRGIHHKSRLVIGVEKMPLPWLFDWLSFLIIDLGGTTGQLGVDTQRTVFAADGVRVAPAICYESVYGAYVGEFVRGGAQLLLVITNDGWWRDTAIHRQHFSFARLRAIEHRRAVARSANTGISGFIDARGDVADPTLGWAERGVLTRAVALSDVQTVYTRYGDYLGRMAQYVMALCLLYFVAYRIKRRNYLVD